MKRIEWFALHLSAQDFVKACRYSTSDLYEVVDSFRRSLSSSFNWSGTSEGHTYWQDIADNITTRIDRPNYRHQWGLLLQGELQKQYYTELVNQDWDYGRDEVCHHLGRAIDQGFAWDTTPQGHPYWSALCSKASSFSFTDWDTKFVDEDEQERIKQRKRMERSINKWEFVTLHNRVDIVTLSNGKLCLKKNAVQCIDDDNNVSYVTRTMADELAEGDYNYISSASHYYRDAICHNDRTWFCDYSEEIFYEDDTWVDVNDKRCFEDFISRYHIVWSAIDDCYYDHDDEDVVHVIGRRDNGYMHRDNATYCDADNEYYQDDDACEYHGFRYDDDIGEWVIASDDDNDDEDADATVRSYHHFSRVATYTRDTPKWTIGFEVEKEDYEQKTMRDASDIYSDIKWCLERDGSLDDRKGYELVSPIFDMYDDAMLRKHLANPDVKRLVNGKFSERCGGHINIASTLYTPDELANGIMGFMPLLYSMYEARLDRDYSRAKDKHKYFYDKGKYSAMYIKPNLVEIRLFPAVKNVDNLLWRTGLIRIMVENMYKSEFDVLKMILNTRSRLYKHLAIIFDDAKIMEKASKFIKYSSMYNGTKLEMPKKKKQTTK